MDIPTVKHADPAVETTLREAAALHPDDRDVVTIIELAIANGRRQLRG